MHLIEPRGHALARSARWRHLPHLGHQTLHLDDCAVPAINLVSNEGTGFKNSIIGLDGTQMDVAAVCTGIARVAISEAVS